MSTTAVPGQVNSMKQATPKAIKQSIYEYYNWIPTGNAGANDFPPHSVGDRLVMGDGRVFHYAEAAYTATTALATPAILYPGQMMTSGTNAAYHRAMTFAAAAKGVSTVVATPGGSTAAEANYYAEGFLNFGAVAGTGYARYYKVKSHLAIAAAAFSINLYDPLETAITASTTGSLTVNPWGQCVVYPASTAVSVPIGVPLIQIPLASATNRYFFWAQTWGPCSLLANTTMTVGQPVGVSGTAGSALTLGAYTTAAWGWMLNPEATTAYSLVYLTIAP